MEKKLQKNTSAYYCLLVAQDLWIVHYQILSLKEFIELNVNLEAMIKNMKHVELNISITTVSWNT